MPYLMQAAALQFRLLDQITILVGQQMALDLRHCIDRSEEHTSELQSLMRISYAVFCLKKKTQLNSKSQHATTQPSLTSPHRHNIIHTTHTRYAMTYNDNATTTHTINKNTQKP